MAEHDERLQRLIAAIFDVHQDSEIDCQTCYEEFACLGELVARGADLGELLPAVEQHLRCCPDCREEFEALLAIIRAEDGGQLAAPSEN